MAANRQFLMILMGLSALLAHFTYQEWQLIPDGNTHVYILDVGQGDSILIQSPTGKQIVVDGGPNRKALDGIGKHLSFFDRHIDLLILSHPDLDHCFSFPEILDRYTVDALMLTAIAHHSPCYTNLLDAVHTKNIPVIVAGPTSDVAMGDGLFIDVLWPPAEQVGMVPKDGANNTSIVFRLVYGQDTMLFTGDMEEVEEHAVLAAGVDVHADILKVAHHGSKTSTSTGFLLAVDPASAVIPVGKDNRFGHPHSLILDRFTHFSIPIRRTDEEGEIGIVMDGV